MPRIQHDQKETGYVVCTLISGLYEFVETSIRKLLGRLEKWTPCCKNGIELGTPAGIDLGAPARVVLGTPDGIVLGAPDGIELGAPYRIELVHIVALPE